MLTLLLLSKPGWVSLVKQRAGVPITRAAEDIPNNLPQVGSRCNRIAPNESSKNSLINAK